MLILAWIACAAPEAANARPTTSDAPCPRTAVVTDIDETLTVSDGEWLTQLTDADYDPSERPEAHTLIQGYADRGYAILYLTARGEDLAPAGHTARELTVDWLVAHGFPVDEDLVVLATGVGALGSAAAPYKTEVLAALVADGWSFPVGYGNADTDMQAFETVVPLEQLHMVGVNAGEAGYEAYVAVPDADAFAAHLAVLDDVPDCTR